MENIWHYQTFHDFAVFKVVIFSPRWHLAQLHGVAWVQYACALDFVDFEQIR